MKLLFLNKSQNNCEIQTMNNSINGCCSPKFCMMYISKLWLDLILYFIVIVNILMQLVLKWNYSSKMCILQNLETMQYPIIQLLHLWIL
jgi:hypothetical protein